MGSDNGKKSVKADKNANGRDDVAPVGPDSDDPGSSVMPGDEDFDVVVIDEAELSEDEELGSTLASFVSGRVEADLVQANLAAVGSATADSVEANLSAVGVAKTDALTSIGSAIALATVEGDADINTSMVPLLISRGDANFHQAYSSAFIAGGTVNVRQAAAPIIVGKQLSVQQGGGLVMLASEAEVKQGFVGLLVSPNATLSEDSRVLLSTKAALIVAAALLGGFGILAVVMLVGARRVSRWRPHISLPSMPGLAELEERFHVRHK